MKRILAQLFACLILMCGCSNGVGSDRPDTDLERFLKVDGKVIRNNSGMGDVVSLYGINLGGWLLREGWMDPIGYDYKSNSEFMDDYGSRTLMIERFGEEAVDDLLAYYHKVYIQESDLDIIDGLGLNFVRVPVFWEVFLDRRGKFKDNAFDRLDWLISECSKRDMYVVIDLHGAPGGHSDGYQTGGHLGSNELWTNAEYQQWTINIWQAIAERYKDNPTVMAYDLLNEPVAAKDSGYTNVTMYDMLYQAVRKVDPDHIIMMGAFYNFDYLCDPKEYGWTNVIYQTHHYMSDRRWDAAGQRAFMEGQLAYIKHYRDKWNVPVYPGEYNFWNHPQIWQDWLEGLNKENIMWSSWTYKNTDSDEVNCWGIYTDNKYPRPNVRVDMPEDFKAKWDFFASEHYSFNSALADVIRLSTVK